MECCSNSNNKEPKRVECPKCNQFGGEVQILTLENQIQASFKKHISAISKYYFCQTPTCEIVYHGANFDFTKDHLIERVTIKDNDLNVKVCYCFNFTRADLIEDIESKCSNLVNKIKFKIKNEKCFCEKTNPEGICCLKRINSLASANYPTMYCLT